MYILTGILLSFMTYSVYSFFNNTNTTDNNSYDEDGNLHSENGEPAYLDKNVKKWYTNGMLNNVPGKPAIVINLNLVKKKHYYMNKIHNILGPAVYVENEFGKRNDNYTAKYYILDVEVPKKFFQDMKRLKPIHFYVKNK